MRGAVRKNILFREDFGGGTQSDAGKVMGGGAIRATPEIDSDSGSCEALGSNQRPCGRSDNSSGPLQDRKRSPADILIIY